MTDTQARLLPCICGAPVGAICKRPDCESPAREVHMAAASDPGHGTRPSPPASAEVVERVARAIDPVAWRWIDDMERDAPDHIALATTKQNRLDTAKRAIQASGAAVQVPEDVTTALDWYEERCRLGDKASLIDDAGERARNAKRAIYRAAAPQKQGA